MQGYVGISGGLESFSSLETEPDLTILTRLAGL